MSQNHGGKDSEIFTLVDTKKFFKEILLISVFFNKTWFKNNFGNSKFVITGT